nr:hypothetical protein [Tanacetum cinerariifolium]
MCVHLRTISTGQFINSYRRRLLIVDDNGYKDWPSKTWDYTYKFNKVFKMLPLVFRVFTCKSKDIHFL